MKIFKLLLLKLFKISSGKIKNLLTKKITQVGSHKNNFLNLFNEELFIIINLNF